MGNLNLPPGWVWKMIGEIADTTSGGTPLRSHIEYYGGNIPWIKSGELRDGIIRKSDETITELGFTSSSAKLFPKGTVVVALYGATVGKTGILDIEASSNQAVCAIFPRNHSFITKYMFYWLQSQRKNLISQSMGGAQPNISQGIIRALPFPLPPLPEQERIVERIEILFTQLDAGVAGLKRAQVVLKRYKASVLKAACEGRLVPQDPSDEPAEDLLQRLGNLPLSDEGLLNLPSGWCWTHLPAIGDLARGKSKHRPRNDPFLYGGSYPFVQTGDIRQANGTITTYSQTYSDAGLKQSKLWKKGTLCITIAANIAETAILGFDACFPDSIVGFIPLDKIETRFVQYFINTVKDDLERYAPATAQKNINLDILQKIAIPLPPLTELQYIVAEVERRLSMVQVLEQTIESNLKRAGRLRQAILKRAFEGRL